MCLSEFVQSFTDRLLETQSKTFQTYTFSLKVKAKKTLWLFRYVHDSNFWSFIWKNGQDILHNNSACMFHKNMKVWDNMTVSIWWQKFE